MSQKISKFVFKNRRFIHITIATVPIPVKYFLGGTTSLTLWIIGFLIMLSGITFRVLSASYLSGKHTTTTINADYICTSGPFAYIRNPLYLGNFIIGLGLGIAFNEWYGYVILALHFLSIYSILIFYEEKFMAEKFGAVYAEYKAHTRRIVPKLKPYKDGPTVHPNFKLGISSEKYHFLILLILFAILHFLFIQ